MISPGVVDSHASPSVAARKKPSIIGEKDANTFREKQNQGVERIIETRLSF